MQFSSYTRSFLINKWYFSIIDGSLTFGSLIYVIYFWHYLHVVIEILCSILNSSLRIISTFRPTLRIPFKFSPTCWNIDVNSIWNLLFCSIESSYLIYLFKALDSYIIKTYNSAMLVFTWLLVFGGRGGEGGGRIILWY